MSVLGHVAVGAIAARAVSARDVSLPRLAAYAVAFAALALLPDTDLVLHALAPQVHLFAHRGPSHSLAVAALIGTVVALAAPAGTRARLGVLVAAVVASHGLLDALGTSGLGVELLWPFTGIRFLAPWHMLPNVDLARPVASIVAVLALELVLFAPAWLYALWPRTALPAETSGVSRARR